MSGLIVKTFAVAADGFPAMNWTAKSRGKALALAWDSYRSYRDIAFKEFLMVARSWRVADPEGFGRSITVCGEPAFWISQNSQYVRFVRANSDMVLNAHPLDVTFDGDPPPMPETMSPREKVAQIVSGAPFPSKRSYDKADAILTALASSGDHSGDATNMIGSDHSGGVTDMIDHAELARLAEAAKRVRRDSLGRIDGLDAGRKWDAFTQAANPATVLALLAEIAALNDYGRSVAKEALGYRDQAIEAERKLAEAVGLLRDFLPWSRKFPDLKGRITTFLSKEAERG